MKCPRCGSENQNDNFCGHCANPLKEKCPECGELEPIGRGMCLKRVNELEAELMKELSAVPFPPRLLYPTLVFFTGFVGLLYPMTIWSTNNKLLNAISMFGGGITMVLGIFWLNLRSRRAEQLRKKIAKNFFALHPDYQGILRLLE